MSCVAMSFESVLPLCKSWTIRMGFQDVMHSKHARVAAFLDSEHYLGGDLLALRRLADDWPAGGPLRVGESGTILRFFLFLMCHRGVEMEVVTQGTLRDRGITFDKSIVGLSLEDLLKLNTSQFASAVAIVRGDARPSWPMPYHLSMTFDSIVHWHEHEEAGTHWERRVDATIRRQAIAFAGRKGRKVDFVPIQPEDYCFARAFGIVSPEEGLRHWPSLRGHETDRIVEMERAIDLALHAGEIDSMDHRVVQAVAMMMVANGNPFWTVEPSVVNKTWPQFWDFLNACSANG